MILQFNYQLQVNVQRIPAMKKPLVPTSKATTSASANLDGKEMASAVQVRADLFTF